MVYRFLPLALLFLMSFASKTTNNVKFSISESVSASNVIAKIELVYNSLDANSFAMPQIDCFKKAMLGFYSLKEKGLIEKDILTVIDFSMSSTKKRMWVIDLVANKILFNTVVSHGMKSGLEYANSLSNEMNSNKPKLRFRNLLNFIFLHIQARTQISYIKIGHYFFF